MPAKSSLKLLGLSVVILLQPVSSLAQAAGDKPLVTKVVGFTSKIIRVADGPHGEGGRMEAATAINLPATAGPPSEYRYRLVSDAAGRKVWVSSAFLLVSPAPGAPRKRPQDDCSTGDLATRGMKQCG